MCSETSQNGPMIRQEYSQREESRKWCIKWDLQLSDLKGQAESSEIMDMGEAYESKTKVGFECGYDPN